MTFTRTDLPVTGEPAFVAVGDFDTDGVPDLAVANFAAATVSVLLGNGSGAFDSAGDFGVSSGPLSVAVSDLNGDGAADLAVVNYNHDDISLLLGDGNGSFAESVYVPVGSIPTSVASSDFNADGVVDLAVANLGSDSVTVLLGDGSLGFTRTDVAVGTQPRMLVAADIDVDGNVDLAVANHTSASISVLSGDGAGRFERSDIVVGSQPRSIASADFNGDGFPDLVAGNYGVASVSVLNSGGTGGFDRRDVGVGEHPRAVAAGDFDGDGNADIAVASHANDSVSMLLGDGRGAFVPSDDIGVSAGPYHLATGDVTMDDHPDLVVANQDNDSISILVNGGTAPATGPTCGARHIASGPPERTLFGVSDLRSGLASIDVSAATNAAVRIGTFVPYGQFSHVEVVVTRLEEAEPLQFELTVVDGAGNTSICSSDAPPTTTTAPTTTTTVIPPVRGRIALVSSFIPTHLRRDFSGWVGSSLKVGPDRIHVSALGRWVVAGNTGSHRVRLVDAAIGAVVASTTVDTMGAPAGAFHYADLDTPLTLRARATYYLLSEETAGGDAWYDYDTRVETTPAAAATGVVYALADSPMSWARGGGTGDAFGPLSLLYGTDSPTTTTTVPSATSTTAPTSTIPATTTVPSTTTTAPTTTTTVAVTTTTVPGDGRGAPLVTSFTPTHLRNDFSGWVGSTLGVGPDDLRVSALGRWVVAGNTGSHRVILVDAATGALVASTTVDTMGAPASAFRYGGLRTPVTLRAGAAYYLVSEETAGGDAWYDYDTRVVTTPAAADTGVVYAFAHNPTNWARGGSPGNAFGPLSLLYTTGSPTTTTTTVPTATSTTTTSTTTTSTTTTTVPATTTTTTTTVPAPTTTTVPITTTTVPGGGSGTPLVTSFTPTHLRNDLPGWVGSTLRVGPDDLRVSALGRWVVAGNRGSHRLKLVDAATGADVASTTVETAGAPAGAFRYADLGAPVTLRAGAAYYLVSEETAGGDAWYDYDTRVVTTPAAAVTGVVYAFAHSPTNWARWGSPGSAFGPLSLLYG